MKRPLAIMVLPRRSLGGGARLHHRMEFCCFQPVEEIRQPPSSNGTARTSEEELFALQHRTKRSQHLRDPGRWGLQHLMDGGSTFSFCATPRNG